MVMENKELDQGSSEWLEMRKSHVGASDIAVILGISPFKTPYVLWQEKIGMKEQDEPNLAMMIGKGKEEEARNAYIKSTGNCVIPRTCYFKNWTTAIASLDGCNELGDIICEIKCPGDKAFQDSIDNGVPPHYFAQIQWQLMISEAKVCHYFCYIDENKHHMIEVKPDIEYQEGLLLAAKQFWVHVEDKTPPALTQRDYLVNEEEEPNALAEKWKEKRNKKKALEEEMKELQKKLLDYTDDGNTIFKKAEVRVARISKKGTIDWKIVCDKFKLDPEELDCCRKKSYIYPVFSITTKKERFLTF
jgi:putative phage-type endonuclease